MSLPSRFLIAGTLSLALLTGSASAAEEPSNPGDEWVRQNVKRYGHVGTTIERVRKSLQYQFDLADIDGGGVSESDYVVRRQKRLSQARSSVVARWVSADLNGDREVTRAELETSYFRSAHTAGSSVGAKPSPARERAEKMLRKLVDDLLTADGDRDGVISLAEALAYADDQASKDRKANRPAKVAVPPSFDTDGDGIITQGEFDEHVVRVLTAIDKDGDGAFSRKELAALTQKAGKAPGKKSGGGILQSFDKDGDGVVSDQELDVERDEFVAALDRDGDGKLSQQEFSAFSEELDRRNKTNRARRHAQRKQEEGRKLAEACGVPPAPEGARILLLGAYGGQALSTVSLGGDDKVIQVADVSIEPGSEPLYILLSSYSAMIWRFTGAVERVASVFANTQIRDTDSVPRVGVVGLPKDRVFIAKQTKCLGSFSSAATRRGTETLDAVFHMVGRDPDSVLTHHEVSVVHLPSGRFETQAAFADAVDPPEGDHTQALWHEVLVYNPGGLVRIDASAVASRSVAKEYATLPEFAGLAQLVDQQALRVIGTMQAIGKKTDPVLFVPNKFLIQKKIQFPAGLSGGLGAPLAFVLGPGVPKPEGSPGSARVTN